MSAPVLLVYDEAMLGHNPTGWDPDHPEWTELVKKLLADLYPDKDLTDYAHPERPQRLSAIVDHLRTEVSSVARWARPEPARREELGRVHTMEHVARIEALRGRSGWLARDTTAVSPESVTAANLAAGAGIQAVNTVVEGECKKAFCLVRPPGHHAPSDSPMGFCLFNNVAVAAAHARAAHGMERVLIWDWDLHHGNGTQAIFFDDPGVLFIDTHCEAPFYPGSGTLDEIGAHAGTGYNLNLPLPPGSGNRAMIAALDGIILPAARAFRPDLVLISAGFDMHFKDRTFAMDETGFGIIASRMAHLAEECCGGRLVAMLEGGYNTESLSASARMVVRALAGEPPEAFNVLGEDPGLAAAEVATRHHADQIRSIARRGGPQT